MNELRLRPRWLVGFIILNAVVAIGTKAAVTSAGPTVLDPGGLPVCAATGEQLLPRAIPAGDGAAIIVWQDKRRGGSLSDIYALSVAANGTVTPGWPDDGLLLCGTGVAGRPFPVPDGAGGALVFWHDGRNSGQLYAQRVSAGGVLADGWPADGKQLTTLTLPDAYPLGLLDAIPDGVGGAYVARHSYLGFSRFAVVNRFTSDGAHASGWSETAISYFADNGDGGGVLSGVLAEDPGSGVFFAYRRQGPSPEMNTKATIARISAGGTSLWQVDPPAPSSVFPAGVGGIDIASDATGGCFTTWSTYDWSIPSSNSYRQRYSASGSTQWPVHTSSPTWQHVEMDGAGGAFLVGTPLTSTSLEVHRRGADGSIPPGWTNTGIPISTPTALGSIARSSVDGDLLLCWSENRTGAGHDVRAIAIDPAGTVTPGWATDGTLISDAAGNQTVPDVAIMSPGQFIACWQDTRTGGSDIRATRVGYTVTGVPPGRGPSRLALGTAWPNPAREHARFSLALAPGERATAEVIDMSGRLVRRIGSLESGASQDFQIDTRGLAPGVYWLLVTQLGERASRRFAVMR